MIRFSSFVLILIFSIKSSNTQVRPYRIQSVRQFPGGIDAKSFNVKGQFLAVEKISSDAHQLQFENTNIYVYQGSRFKELVKQSRYMKLSANGPSTSNAGQFIIDGKIKIVKNNFFDKRNIPDLFPKGNFVARDNKTQFYSIYNKTSKCPTLAIMNISSKHPAYHSLQEFGSKNCYQSSEGQLENLSFGLMVLTSKTALYIIKKDNLQTYQKIIIEKCVNQIGHGCVILGVTTSYFPEKNQSNINIQIGDLASYQRYSLNHETQKYELKGQSFHPATKPYFFNTTTSISLYMDYLVYSSNAESFYITNNETLETYNLKNVTILTVSLNSELALGYDNTSNSIVEYKYQSDSKKLIKNRNFHLTSLSYHCITKGEFTQNNDEALLQVTNCRSGVKENICKLTFSNSLFQCLYQKTQTNNDYRYSGIPVFNFEPIQSKSFINIKWLLNQYKFSLQQRSLGTINSPFSEVQIVLDEKNKYGTIQDVRIIRNTEWINSFAIAIKTNITSVLAMYSYDLNTKSITKISEFLEIVNFDVTQPFGKYIVTIKRSTTNSTQCKLELYNLNFVKVTNQQILYENCFNIKNQYQIITQDKSQKFFVRRSQSTNGAHLVDVWTFNQTSGRLEKQNFFQKPIISRAQSSFTQSIYLPKQKILILYSPYPYQQFVPYPVMNIYNVSKIPIKMFKISSSSSNKFNFQLPDLDHIDLNQYQFGHIISRQTGQYYVFTFNKTFFYFSNPTQKVQQIIQTQRFQNYTLPINFFSVSNDSEILLKPQRTVLPSTNKHVISIIYKKNSTNLVLSQILPDGSIKQLRILQFQGKGEVIQQVIDADITHQGYGFVSTNESIYFFSYIYIDQINKQLPPGTFYSGLATNDQQNLVYAIQTSNQTSIRFKSDIMTSLSVQDLTLPIPVLNLKLSSDGKIVSIQTQQFIITKRINSDQLNKFLKKSMDSILVDREIFILDNASKLETKIKGNSSKYIDIPNSQVFLYFYEDYLDICGFSMTHCSQFKNIKGKYIKATSQQYRLLAYVQPQADMTYITRVLRIKSFDQIQSVVNITLPKQRNLNTGEYFVPKPVQLDLDGEDLYIRAEDSKQFHLIYKISPDQCPTLSEFKNGQCACAANSYKKDISYKDSKVVQSYSCSCYDGFFLNLQKGQCDCPGTFKYDQGYATCFCDGVPGNEEYNQQAGTFTPVCIEDHSLRTILLSTLIPIVSIILCCIGCCCWEAKLEKDRISADNLKKLIKKNYLQQQQHLKQQKQPKQKKSLKKDQKKVISNEINNLIRPMKKTKTNNNSQSSSTQKSTDNKRKANKNNIKKQENNETQQEIIYSGSKKKKKQSNPKLTSYLDVSRIGNPPLFSQSSSKESNNQFQRQEQKLNISLLSKQSNNRVSVLSRDKLDQNKKSFSQADGQNINQKGKYSPDKKKGQNKNKNKKQESRK